MTEEYLSLRMRSLRAGRHISGAERLMNDMTQLEDAALAMIERALAHPRGRADRVVLKVEPVAEASLRFAKLLPVQTNEVADWQQGRKLAARLLVADGLDSTLVDKAMQQLANGPAPGGQVMRGAMLLDTASGSRLEKDPARGVRVCRMDVNPAKQAEVSAWLASRGLSNPRILEAWLLASKVALCPEIVAELCWSDDPDYLTGYVASAAAGYQRITRLKNERDPMGGRIFFVKPGVDLGALVTFLEYQPLLFSDPDSP
ncbi:MAG: 6-carboxyhexanoate--CoA ligase [Deltaproteobacteria bacterium]|nr:6-carboxyhexanoate--CoA ligase [Deltaproteobacteria bacterium]